MIARIQKSVKDRDQGFTLIELLVVMIIIGILAAIAVPVFLSQRAKAQDTATKADASKVGQAIATYFVDNKAAPDVTETGGKYMVGTEDAGNQTTNVLLNGAPTFGTVPANAWCVAFRNDAGAKKNWVFSAGGGLQEGTCAAQGVRQAP